MGRKNGVWVEYWKLGNLPTAHAYNLYAVLVGSCVHVLILPLHLRKQKIQFWIRFF
jgi:hypothetical protein